MHATVLPGWNSSTPTTTPCRSYWTLPTIPCMNPSLVSVTQPSPPSPVEKKLSDGSTPGRPTLTPTPPHSFPRGSVRLGIGCIRLCPRRKDSQVVVVVASILVHSEDKQGWTVGMHFLDDRPGTRVIKMWWGWMVGMLSCWTLDIVGGTDPLQDPWTPNPKLLPRVRGKNKERMLRTLEALFPREDRSTASMEAGDNPVVLEMGETIPICFLVFPPASPASDPVLFYPATVTDLLLPQKGRPDSESCPALATASVMLQATEDESVHVKLFPRGDQLQSLVEFLQPLKDLPHGGTLWKDWKPSFLKASNKNSWTSGAFLDRKPNDEHQLALFTNGKYSVHVNLVNDKSVCALKTSGFADVGGENIGSLFQVGSTLYANARVTVPYNLHSMLGHGYRQSGIYRIQFQCPSEGLSCACTARGDLVAVHALEDKCLAQCASFTTQQSRLPRISVDGWHAFRCEGAKPQESNWTRSLDREVFQDCLLRSSRSRLFAPLLDGLSNCSISCRMEQQVYQSGVYTLFQRLFAMFGYMYENNGVYLCHGNEETLKFRCFSKPMFFAKTKPGHPVHSNLVLTKRSVVTACSCTHRVNCCTMATNRWSRDRFCSIPAQSNEIFVTTLPLIVKSPCIKILYRTSTFGGSCETSRITLELESRGMWQQLEGKLLLERQMEGEMLCKMEVRADVKRHRLRLRFSHLAIVGIQGSHCAA